MTKKKQKTDWRVILGGMACITILELYALSQGINGVALTAVIAVIAAFVGLKIETPKILQ